LSKTAKNIKLMILFIAALILSSLANIYILMDNLFKLESAYWHTIFVSLPFIIIGTVCAIYTDAKWNIPIIIYTSITAFLSGFFTLIGINFESVKSVIFVILIAPFFGADAVFNGTSVITLLITFLITGAWTIISLRKFRKPVLSESKNED